MLKIHVFLMILKIKYLVALIFDNNEFYVMNIVVEYAIKSYNDVRVTIFSHCNGVYCLNYTIIPMELI